MRLSVVIPVLNEARQLPDLLAHLLPLHRNGHEIIFADGGSTRSEERRVGKECRSRWSPRTL